MMLSSSPKVPLLLEFHMMMMMMMTMTMTMMMNMVVTLCRDEGGQSMAMEQSMAC
jgi:hypothetical protein